jgi:hypothetical protein
MAKRAAPTAGPKAEKAPAAPKAPKAKADASDEKATRRQYGRGWLAGQVESICRKHNEGKLKGYDAGAPLTVSTLQSLITNSDGEAPSTGAIAAVLTRWHVEEYTKGSGKPLAFTGYMAKWKDSSLEAFLEARSAKKAKERAAAKKAA